MSGPVRKIVQIDEERCDGCGACVPSCAEGAIAVVDGKARLAADKLCDGLGACLGDCPRGAITIIERAAEAFDEAAVEARGHGGGTAPHAPAAAPAAFAPAPPPRRGLPVVSAPAGPSGRRRAPPADGARAEPEQSSTAGRGALPSWPVQLRLVPVGAPFLAGADLLLAADCVPFACPTFHAELLPGRKVVCGCPKLDDLPAYAEKLARMLAQPDGPARVTVARMEVPCCAGLAAAARQAAAHAGREVPVREIVVGVDGVVRE